MSTKPDAAITNYPFVKSERATILVAFSPKWGW